MNPGTLALGTALVTSFYQPGEATAPVSREVLDLLERGIPRSGCVAARFASEHGAGESEAGYEATSGAWYWISGDRALGCDAQGRMYTADRGGIRHIDRPDQVDIQNWAYIFPFLATRYYLENHADLTDVVLLPGGALRLEMRLERGSRSVATPPDGIAPRGPMLEWLELGSDARPIALWDDRLNPRRDFSYPPGVTPPLWVPDRIFDQRLVSYQASTQPDEAAFKPQQVRQRLVEAAARIEQALRANTSSYALIQGAAGTPPAADGGSTPATEPGSQSTSGQESWRPPWLLLAGGVLMAAAGIVLWKRRA